MGRWARRRRESLIADLRDELGREPTPDEIRDHLRDKVARERRSKNSSVANPSSRTFVAFSTRADREYRPEKWGLGRGARIGTPRCRKRRRPAARR
jgi:hypothetical protein